jgi:hypothetical protein
MSRLLTVALLGLLLGACGGSMSGTYENESGLMRYTFSSDGTVVQSAMGVEVEMTYEVVDDRVLLQSPVGELVLKRIDRDTLEGPFGMRLERRP